MPWIISSHIKIVLLKSLHPSVTGASKQKKELPLFWCLFIAKNSNYHHLGAFTFNRVPCRNIQCAWHKTFSRYCSLWKSDSPSSPLERIEFGIQTIVWICAELLPHSSLCSVREWSCWCSCCFWWVHFLWMISLQLWLHSEVQQHFHDKCQFFVTARLKWNCHMKLPWKGEENKSIPFSCSRDEVFVFEEFFGSSHQ